MREIKPTHVKRDIAKYFPRVNRHKNEEKEQHVETNTRQTFKTDKETN